MSLVLTVTGSLDGAVYRVRVTGDGEHPVVGSGPIAALVSEWIGRKVSVTPAGPLLEVDPGDETSILALLGTETTVLSTAEAATQEPAAEKVAA